MIDNKPHYVCTKATSRDSIFMSNWPSSEPSGERAGVVRVESLGSASLKVKSGMILPSSSFLGSISRFETLGDFLMLTFIGKICLYFSTNF